MDVICLEQWFSYLLKIQISQSHLQIFLLIRWILGFNICIPNYFSGDIDAAGPGTTVTYNPGLKRKRADVTWEK